MKTTSILLVLALTLPASGETYTIEWENTEIAWTGTVDTKTDQLTILSWETFVNPYYVVWEPEGVVGSVWQALDLNGFYDVPDDWNGTVDDWGFVARDIMMNSRRPGFGCGSCVGWDKCATFIGGGQDSMSYRLDWWTRPPGTTGHDAWMLHGASEAARMNIQPVSAGRIPGDVNLDNVFQSDDLVKTFAKGFYETGSPASWPDGDWTRDEVFDSSDMVAAFVAGRYERQPFEMATAAVPEPSSTMIILMGFISLSWRRRYGHTNQ
jgi:hypothetical protein